MTFFEVLVARRLRRVRRRARRRRGRRGRAWAARGTRPTSSTARSPSSRPIALDHERFLGNDVEDIATEKSGIIKPGAVAVIGLQEPDVAEILLERGRGGRRPRSPSRATTSASSPARSRSAASSCRSAASPGTTTTCSCRCTARTRATTRAAALAAVEAFVGGGQQRAGARVVRAGLARRDLPGAARDRPRVRRPSSSTPRTTRPARRRLRRRWRTRSPSPGVIGVVAVLEDKDAASMLEILEPVLDEVVVTRTTSPRAMSPTRLGELAAEIYGEDRVTVVDSLPDALDRAAGLADEGGCRRRRARDRVDHHRRRGADAARGGASREVRRPAPGRGRAVPAGHPRTARPGSPAAVLSSGARTRIEGLLAQGREADAVMALPAGDRCEPGQAQDVVGRWAAERR